MKVAENIGSIVGKTPLVKLQRCIIAEGNTVAVKLEQLNPGGSVKDRTAMGMIMDAEKKGLLRNRGTIVEATSGNTGIAMAMFAASRNYSAIIVMPESMSNERKKLLVILGAEVILTPAHLGMQGAVDKARAIVEALPGSIMLGQFDNPANAEIHCATTAQELLDDTDGKIDVFIAGSGTGGTISGVGRALKNYKESIKVIAVEPLTSNVLSGGRPGAHKIQGIGPGFVPSIFDRSVVDEIITVNDTEAISWTKSVIQQEGILAGISSGAVACAIHRYLQTHGPKNQMIVGLFPDSFERYLSLSKIFIDD